MILQIFSDLHVGVRPVKPITVGKTVDVVAVAGDIDEGAQNAFVALRQIVPEKVPVVFVMGNHEYYRRFLRDELATAKAVAPDFNVIVLENDVVVIGGVRFAGASLWTDYRLFGVHNAPAAMRAARNALNDHRLIGWRKEPWERFRPEEALMLHATSRAFLADTLATPFDGSATVVLTHHAPHVNSVPNRFADDILSAAFASAVLGDLVEAGPDRDQCTTIPVRANSGTIDLWIHGHIHDSSDYRVGDTRVIANPHGYGAENPNFDPALVVEIGT